jgi:hypothetical protein
MKHRGIKSVVIVSFLLILFGGCGPKTEMIAIEPVTADLSPYTNVLISAEAAVTEDVSQELSDLEHLTVQKLQELQRFDNIRLGDPEEAPDGTLLIKISISNIKKVSSGARFMLGAFAGKASMTTTVVFVDTASGKELGSYSITGETGGTGLSGNTATAVRKTAEGIVQVISENYGG